MSASGPLFWVNLRLEGVSGAPMILTSGLVLGVLLGAAANHLGSLSEIAPGPTSL